MKATAVIGAAFGDEGKGLMTDYFARNAEEWPIVIRYNGGAQAGHTVVDPQTSGHRRHVFHHFGSGALAGASTFLSEDFLVNPVAYLSEEAQLFKVAPIRPHVTVDPYAKVTTVYDMYVNQQIEKARGNDRHGSCGLGIHETMLRSETIKLTVADLGSLSHSKGALRKIRDYAIDRLALLGLYHEEQRDYLRSEELFERFLSDSYMFLEDVFVSHIHALKNMSKQVIFEGAQGLLLDSECTLFFPHVTHSRTGLHNIAKLCHQLDIDKLDVCYVIRSYLTRHGNGPLPGEDKDLSFEDNTNQPNPWQGTLRFAYLNEQLIERAISNDLNQRHDITLHPSLAITHCDQFDLTPSEITIPVSHKSFGPTWKDVHAISRS